MSLCCLIGLIHPQLNLPTCQEALTLPVMVLPGTLSTAGAASPIILSHFSMSGGSCPLIVMAFR